MASVMEKGGLKSYPDGGPAMSVRARAASVVREICMSVILADKDWPEASRGDFGQFSGC